ncbi:hypothetical protein [Maribacter sp. 2308TA10-17]|uniref:hypothetical protein n=1 Tax=Maribacter sp. 2308TA10-17 TaxID=3386276 RepID=UPI0039BD70D0
MNIIEKFDRQFEYGSILMNVFIAFQFFILWKQPQLSDIDKIATLSALMLFEFVMVHSGVFMAVMPKKMSLFILIPFYGVFAWAFNSMVSDNLILIAYALVILNRMRFAFSDVSKEVRSRTILKSVLSAMIYFFLFFPAVLAASHIPKLGLDEIFIQSSGYGISNNIEGIFTEFPHAAMAFGLAYYCSLAIMESQFLRRKHS